MPSVSSALCSILPVTAENADAFVHAIEHFRILNIGQLELRVERGDVRSNRCETGATDEKKHDEDGVDRDLRHGQRDQVDETLHEGNRVCKGCDKGDDVPPGIAVKGDEDEEELLEDGCVRPALFRVQREKGEHDSLEALDVDKNVRDSAPLVA